MAVLLDEYRPFDTGPGAVNYAEDWRKWMRHFREDGVIASNKEPNTPNELLVYGDSTGMQVKVLPGECYIQGHWGWLQSEKVMSIPAAHGSLARIDRVVLRADFVQEFISIEVLSGTPGSGEPPELTQDTTRWEMPLARVAVGAGVSTITANDVLDERVRSGTGMTSTFTPDLLYANGNLPVGMGNNPVKLCRYRLEGTTLFVRYIFQWGSGTWFGGQGRVYTTLPTGMVARSDGSNRLVAHLRTATPETRDFAGVAVVEGQYVYPMFATNLTDCRLRYYAIDTGAGYPRTPDFSWPEGGYLAMNGVIELEDTASVVVPPDPGGGGTVQQFTTTYTCDWSRTWDSGGARTSTGYMYQGYYSSGAGGYEWSKFGFNETQIQADLAGATIVKVELYLKNAHAYWSSGLNVMLGWHNDTFDGATSPQTGNWNSLSSEFFNKYQEKWITLNNSVGEQFKNGTMAGFTLGSPSSGSNNTYGYFDGRNNTYPPKLRITYNKAV